MSEHTPCRQAHLSGVLTVLPAAGPDQEAVLGISFPFTVCASMLEGRIKTGGEEVWGRSQREGDVCRRPVAGGRPGGTRVLHRQMVGVLRAKRVEGACGHAEWQPCVPALHTSTHCLPGGNSIPV